MSQDPLKRLSWDDFRIVRAIGDTGTLSAAAGVIGVNQSTVFRRLGQIEQIFEVALFERRRSGYVPTLVGLEIMALARRLELDIVSVTHRLAGVEQEPAGDVRVAASDSLALHLLTPIFAEFKALHPAVRFEVIVGNSSLNLARGESDIAVRATNTPPENLIGRKVATIAWASYGRSADFPGGDLPPGDLINQTWATYCHDLSSLKAAKLVEANVSPDNIACRINSVQGLATAISAGLGVGYLPCMFADTWPTLTRVGPIEPELSDNLWLLIHPDIRKAGRVQSFLDYCAKAIARQRSLIEGRDGA